MVHLHTCTEAETATLCVPRMKGCGIVEIFLVHTTCTMYVMYVVQVRVHKLKPANVKCKINKFTCALALDLHYCTVVHTFMCLFSIFSTSSQHIPNSFGTV